MMTSVNLYDPFGFTNVSKGTVGFDDMIKKLTSISETLPKISTYPPYNIRKTGENTYVIEIAVAGFGQQDIEIVMEDGTLTIKGQVNSDEDSEFLFKGIADRAFTRKFTLADTRVTSGEGTIDTSVGNSVNIIISEYDSINSRYPAHSGKVMFEIYDDSPTPRRQYSEVSFLLASDGSDIFYTESNKIYTSDLLVDVAVDIVSGTNNIVANIVDVTGSSTVVYTIKVVSQSILT